ncbi:MAG TPA: AsmA-like C-terminal domain-containing protein, partial [Thermohalobaculum sp.]|nr:AsmA-like C-terminal domain-containing protein [Thermohalobaculum sp.]
GATSSILTLIDEQPLGLIAKLGLDPAVVKGNAVVKALVSFPLIQALELDEVEVEADAQLFALRLPFRLPGDRIIDVAGETVALRANKRELRLSGPVHIDGTPMVLDWNEYYGRGSNHRTIALDGPATLPLLAQFGLDTEYFVGGQAPMKLNLEQTGKPEYAFDLVADLGPAQLKIADFGWDKAPGAKGQLVANGSFGGGVRVPQFRLDAGDLKATGSIEFSPGGKLQKARVARLQYRGQADIALAVDRVGDGPDLALNVTGNRLDLAMFDDLPAAGPANDTNGGANGATPLAVRYSLDELVVTRKIVSLPATGTYRRDAGRNAVAALDGKLAGQVPFQATYEKNHAEPATVRITADDAGGMLVAADLFKGAQGGTLELTLRIAPEGGADLVGVAIMRDVKISGTGTFTSILDEGDLPDAAKAAEQGGLSFDKVKVPFEYHEGLLTLDDVTAKGKLLAVTLEGTVNENNDELDLVGVISPAYAITGLLDNIPVIREILSGGKGEGILAMTFKINGSLDDPDFSVNPLSLLAPGILRKVFSGRSASPNEKFLESLKREID